MNDGVRSRWLWAVAALALTTIPFGAGAHAQSRPPARKPAAPPPPANLTKMTPQITCPAPLGIGVKTKLAFCEVLAGRDPEGGVLIKLPPHRGALTLTFDLHNLQLYSEEQVKAKRAYARYTASIGVMTMDNTLITRAVVQSEFRTAADLIDRISGGAGPAGVKAVAPTGTESIVVMIPESEEQVSLLGEKVTVEAVGTPPTTFTQAGRPIAVVSNLMIEYRPAPVKPAPSKPKKTG
ncbi:MAG TPA: hypothetical protein VH583_13175 [Vicinamibacterales bacterium]|jgi:hypothetical protein